MARVVLAVRAARDLDEIASHVRRDNPVAALDVLDEIERAPARLASHPRAGRARPELAFRLRSLPVLSWIVFYRPIRGGIAVARVLHSARDIKVFFLS